jgi:hypothetical protein
MNNIFANCSDGTHSAAATFVASTDITNRHRLVAFDNAVNIGKIKLASGSDVSFGVTMDVASAGDIVAVRFLCGNETVLLEAAEAIAHGSVLVVAAGGRVRAIPSASGTYQKIGIAIGIASGAGDVIEVLPYVATIITIS